MARATLADHVKESYRSFCVSVSQVQLQPLSRFQAALGGIGRIRLQKDIHVWLAYSASAIQAVRLLWPYLSDPKRNQALLAMIKIAYAPVRKPNANKTQEFCLRGHKFSETGVCVNPRGGRECRACRDQRRHGRLPPIQPRVCPPDWLVVREYSPSGDQPRFES